FDLRNAGIGRYSMNLLEALVNKGFDVEYLSQDSSLLHSDLGYFVYTSLEIPLKISSDADIFHACSPMEALWVSGRPHSVVTFHDLIPIIYPNMSKGGIINSIKEFLSSKYFKLACKMATNSESIISVSEETARDLLNSFHIDEDKINVVRQAIAGGLKPLNKKEGDKYRIGTLGYFEPRKRIDVLIKAFLDADIEDSELLIAGKGP